MELDKAFGLPAHALLVHAAVVLVPLAAIALIAVGWKQAWRRQYYPPVALLAMGGAIAAFLAKQSGEPLAESVRHAGKKVGEHPEQGDTAFVLAMVFAGAAAIVYAWETFGAKVRERFGWEWRLPVDDGVALYIAAIPFAALAIWAMIAAGHSGATLVWKTNR